MEGYSGKKVVVTGGAGMVGHRLVGKLLQSGADVTVVDDFSRGQNIVGGARYLELRIGSNPASDYGFGNADYVFNLAATVAGVVHNKSHSTFMFMENMSAQAHPVYLAEYWGAKTFVQVSSVCVYSPEHNHPCIEENGLLGEPHPDNGGYAWAKRAGERVAALSSIPHVVIVRPSNIFGPKDYYDNMAHVIPKLIKGYLYNERVRMFGTGSARREFIYSDDVANGLMVAAIRGGNREVYNIGTSGDTLVSMYQLHRMIAELTDSKSELEVLDGVDYGEPDRWSDASKLQSLGWKHEVDLRTGLEMTIKDYINGRNNA